MHHEERLAKRPGSFSEDLVRVERDDVAEREDEGVNVFHVEVVGRDGVRDRVLGEDVRLLDGVAAKGASAEGPRSDLRRANGVMSSGSSSMGL